MNGLLHLLGIAFCLWVIFLGGAEKLENTFVGYLEYGVFADSASMIRLAAWISLMAGIVVWLFQGARRRAVHGGA